MKLKVLIRHGASVLLGCLLFGTVHAQQVDPALPSPPYDYFVPLPAYFFVPAVPGSPTQIAVVDHDNTPGSNPTTNAGAALGRVLFHDPNLSLNQTVSCASCHEQARGFSDPRALSVGFDGGRTRRHSMGLTNARFYQRGRAFWDERAVSLEAQALMPIQDAVEMGMSLPELENRLATVSYYPALFDAAFGDPGISADRIGKALAQFVRSLVSITSRYDQGRAMVANFNQPFPNFSTLENQGKTLFLTAPQAGGAGCGGCHATEAFVNDQNGPINNGLDANSSTDQGAFETFGTPNFLGSFKAPSLRNIGVRAPFMHDGRFSTLAQVVEHYNSGVMPHQNLDRRLRLPNGSPIRLNLTQAQKNALVAFMNTLTDSAFLSDPRYSDPFASPSCAGVGECI
ncbi:cytochrome-c peroxidase, partial [Dokdonella sp.]|uniref:cytochrome-c peroxidase n=1 Tax=Dokdonella sp. TaxID=2291710 RepID=UPI003C622B13